MVGKEVERMLQEGIQRVKTCKIWEIARVEHGQVGTVSGGTVSRHSQR